MAATACRGSRPADGDNFAPLASLDWQVHVYGEGNRELLALCKERSLSAHVFPWREECDRAGLVRNALYLVRPDRYIGLAIFRTRARTR